MNEKFALAFEVQFHESGLSSIFDVDFIFLIRRERYGYRERLQNAFSQTPFYYSPQVAPFFAPFAKHDGIDEVCALRSSAIYTGNHRTSEIWAERGSHVPGSRSKNIVRIHVRCTYNLERALNHTSSFRIAITVKLNFQLFIIVFTRQML